MPRNLGITGGTNSAHGLAYRPEIDGLRALAVLPVILFHAGASFFSGGYVGVDVFFVISGYLITTIIAGELARGEFSILRFYERRARRILPALFFVMLACLPFAWLTMWPGDMLQFARSINQVCIFLSNNFFYHHSDYFDTASEFKPLLHTWSLAVEEQYYLFFPPLMLLLARYAKRWVTPCLCIIAVLSFAYANYQVRHDAGAAYFLLPSRIWELMVGSLIALHCLTHTAPIIPVRYHGGLALAGIALIIAAMVTFTDATPYPSQFTLIPIVGSALIILYARSENLVGKILSLKPFVGIGLVSYSAYLWHQPIFAFARLGGYAEAGLPFFLMLSVLALLLAYFTWRYIETPFRVRGRFSRKKIFILALLASCCFLAIGSAVSSKRGKIRPLTTEQQQLLDYKNYDLSSWRAGTCFITETQENRTFAPECYGKNNHVVLWGDSFGAAFAGGLRAHLSNFSQFTVMGCAPFHSYTHPKRAYCNEVNAFAWKEILRLKPKTLIIHAGWLFYQQQNPAEHLKETITGLRTALPATRIYVIGNLPQWSPNLPDVMLRNKRSIADAGTIPNYGLRKLAAYDAQLKEATITGGATFIPTTDTFCSDGSCMVTATINGRTELVTWDYGHPTLNGAIWLAGELLKSPLRGLKR